MLVIRMDRLVTELVLRPAGHLEPLQQTLMHRGCNCDMQARTLDTLAVMDIDDL